MPRSTWRGTSPESFSDNGWTSESGFPRDCFWIEHMIGDFEYPFKINQCRIMNLWRSPWKGFPSKVNFHGMIGMSVNGQIELTSCRRAFVELALYLIFMWDWKSDHTEDKYAVTLSLLENPGKALRLPRSIYFNSQVMYCKHPAVHMALIPDLSHM